MSTVQAMPMPLNREPAILCIHEDRQALTTETTSAVDRRTEMTNETDVRIAGTLFAHMFSNGTVQLQLRPHALDGTPRPSVAANADLAQTDMEMVFGLSPEEAQSSVQRLLREGYVEREISVAQSRLPALFRQKQLA